MKYSNTALSVIIPTFNEKDNISILFYRISRCLQNLNYEIIVVDDSSPDGTAQMVQELAQKYFVKLIVRKNDRGLATAVVEGFRHASGDVLVVMDADLQHPPEKIMSLVDEVCRGADVAVGSRYYQVNGFGEIGPVRKLMSSGANILARISLGNMSNVRDVQSGFFALKKSVVKDVELKPSGYKILLEILAVGNYKTVKEKGYIFSRRENGKSKLGIWTMVDYIHHLVSLSLRKRGFIRFLKYCIIGSIGIMINTLALFFFTDILGIFYLVSSAIAYEVSIITNFIMNDRWTFKELVVPEKSYGFLTMALYYNMTMILGAVFGIILLYIFREFLSVNYIISNLVSIGIVTIWRYYTSVTTVWRSDVQNA